VIAPAVVARIKAEALREFAAWLRETYPDDVFGTLDGLANEVINDAIRSAGYMRDAVSADMMRRAAGIADHRANELEDGDRDDR